MLCPQCHAGSPDTTDAKLFFAWVRYKRLHDNYFAALQRDMKKAAEIMGVDQDAVMERFAALRLTRPEEDAYIRDYIVKNCAMHGSFIAPLSRMMILQKWILDPVEQKKFAARRSALPAAEPGVKDLA